MKSSRWIGLAVSCLGIVAFLAPGTDALQVRDVPEGTKWGAIAYSDDHKSFGCVKTGDAPFSAAKQAREACRSKDCEADPAFWKGCKVLILGNDHFYVGVGEDKTAAEKAAIRECRRFSTECKIKCTVCPNSK